MNKQIITALFLAASLTRADNVATQAPMTMEQLMGELNLKGGNWTFRFEEPVYARIDCHVSGFPDGKDAKTYTYLSDRAESVIGLYFLVGPWRVGAHQDPQTQNEYTMRIKLSNCNRTNGTALVWFEQKFSRKPWVGIRDAGQLGEFKPSIARNPVLNKEYVLYYYFREGDPYEVKATLTFLKRPEDYSQATRFTRDAVRDFKNADE